MRDLKRLIKIPSISGTSDEALGAYEIKKILTEIPYFKKNPENVMLIPLENDPFDRMLVAGFLKGMDNDGSTVIFTGHYDVVSVDVYGALKDIAFDVDEITKRIDELNLEGDAKKDFESGNWYFGRGISDMKYGLALGIELLRHYSESELHGNILYVAVCGEETNSEGMLAAVPFFNAFAKEKNLNYKLLILPENGESNILPDKTKPIFYNANGKVMPVFVCVGSQTHGEMPLGGLDSNLLVAEIYKEMSLNTEFIHKIRDNISKQPSGLKMQDLKKVYSLTTSLFSVAYFNISTNYLDPDDLMKKLIDVAYRAFENVADFYKQRVNEYEHLTGKRQDYYKAEPKVLTYYELYKSVEKTFEGNLKEHLSDYSKKVFSETKELQSAGVEIIKHLCDLYKNKRPMIVVALLPPFYPVIDLDKKNADVARMLANIDDLITYAKEEYGENLKAIEFSPIADLSYTWLSDEMNFNVLFKNLVGIGTIYNMPTEDLTKFKVPGIWIGSNGKDAHKYTERLDKKYNFEVLPYLCEHLINQTLK